MRRPNFFIIGAAKCGTTALHDYLGQHADVFVTPHKEPPFFSLEYERGLDYYWDTYFGQWNGERMVGESGGKLFPFAGVQAARLAESVPEARLVALLREPVDRAFSHWWMNVSRGWEELSFGEAVERNLRDLEAGITFDTVADEPLWSEHTAQLRRGRVGSRIYVSVGHYARQLHPYLERFSRERLLVISFDDLCRDAAAVTRRAFTFLGVDPDSVELDLTPRNVAQSRRASRSLPAVSRLSRAMGISRLIPPQWKAGFRRAFFQKRVAVPVPDPEVVARLRDHFAPHNRALVELLGADAPAWARRSA